MSLDNSAVVPFTGGAYEIEQSLRFNDDDSAYLEWTPSSAGNRQKWTWSGWVKRGNLGITSIYLFASKDPSANQRDNLRFNSDAFDFYLDDFNSGRLTTNQVFRDSSAWYHIVLAVDTTQATASNRVKLYVNGEQITSFSTSSYPSQNYETHINNTTIHNIGGNPVTLGNNTWDGYLAEVNFIDGQALDASYFGETGNYGEWKPIEYTGTYGTNGFYLPFKQDYTVEGFSTTLYAGTGATQYIGGVGFQPDLVWIKDRSNARNHYLFDAVRGIVGGPRLIPNLTNAESIPTDAITTLSSDGYTIGGTQPELNNNTETYVAWSWDMGGSNASNTDGSITSTVRANPTYGQSIVSYTGNGTAGATIGHGLSSTPELIIFKNRSRSIGWYVHHKDVSNTKALYLSSNLAEDTSSYLNNTSPTSSVVTIGSANGVNANTENIIAYCFHSVSGYSKIGSYTGTGASGNTVTTGFKPAFIMTKRTDTTSDWHIMDTTRDPYPSGNEIVLFPNLSNAEVTLDRLTVTDTGFTITATGSSINASGGTYIYMAFADNREFAYWLDQSGNNNDWESNNLTESDISLDSPTNNFATLNPLDNNGATLYEGNLKGLTENGSYKPIRATFGMSSGKWYWEVYCVTYTSDPVFLNGIIPSDTIVANDARLDGYFYYGNTGYKFLQSTTSVAYGSTYTTGDIIGLAYDADSGTLTCYKNNVSQGVLVSGLSGEFNPAIADASSTKTITEVANFGQDSSFAGNKTAQGNTDSNNIGDFYYTPPSGYLALCTANLSDPAVIPSEHFNTITYTGDGSSSHSITSVGFQPDFVWFKKRSGGTARNHNLYDAVRGTSYQLASNLTNAEANSGVNGVVSFDSDGVTVGTNASVNENTYPFVAWNWKANGSGVSNTDGSITSIVSANQDAGFSIITYSGNSTSGATIGHGLTQKPEMLIVKSRNASNHWKVWHKEFGESTVPFNVVILNLTDAEGADNNNYRAISDSLVTLGDNGQSNGSGYTYLMYAFHSVDGYSKVGSYTGNGSTDGTFVYTGFRPAFVMIKRTSAADSWMMLDAERSSYNLVDDRLKANDSGAEDVSPVMDMVSNGFKFRASSSSINASANTYIYIAFAEVPAKFSNGR